jgi:hypothetical protein
LRLILFKSRFKMANITTEFGPGGYTNAKELLMGLECEVESVHRVGGLESHGWRVTDDGSLRNNGKEFISEPTGVPLLVERFKALHGGIVTWRKADDRFSERTSIHVHVNCQNLSPVQVKNIILMYALYEEFFFSLVEPSRRDNIHCVPLTETHFPAYYRMSLAQMVTRWHKYTALNAKPLSNLGTLEFRHMHGHADPVLLEVWLKTIANLFQVGGNPVNEINARSITTATLTAWFREIFKDAPSVMLNEPFLHQMTTNQRLDIKLAVM